MTTLFLKEPFAAAFGNKLYQSHGSHGKTVYIPRSYGDVCWIQPSTPPKNPREHLQVEASRPNRTRRQRHSVRPPVTLWADTDLNHYLPKRGSGNNIGTGAATQSVRSGGSYGTSSGQWNLRRRPGARAPLGRRPCVPLPVLWHPHHAPQSRIWSRFDWSFQWCRLQVYFIRMLLHQWQRSIFNHAKRRQFHCRARRMDDMQQFQQPLILYTSCTQAAFKR